MPSFEEMERRPSSDKKEGGNYENQGLREGETYDLCLGRAMGSQHAINIVSRNRGDQNVCN